MEKNPLMQEDSKCLQLLQQIRMEERYMHDISLEPGNMKQRIEIEAGQKIDFTSHIKDLQKGFEKFINELKIIKVRCNEDRK